MKSTLGAIKRRVKSMFLSKEARRHAMVGPADLWKMKRDFQMKFLDAVGLKADNYLLDIGCGTLRGGIPLIKVLDSGHYYGVEVREEALAEGRKELMEAGLEDKEPELILSEDLSQLNIDQKFDIMWAFSVLIHMDDDILDKTLGFVSRHLADQGVFYANVNIGESGDHKWQGFPIMWKSLAFYEAVCAKYRLELSDIGSLREHGHISGVDLQDDQRMLKINKIT